MNKLTSILSEYYLVVFGGVSDKTQRFLSQPFSKNVFALTVYENVIFRHNVIKPLSKSLTCFITLSSYEFNRLYYLCARSLFDCYSFIELKQFLEQLTVKHDKVSVTSSQKQREIDLNIHRDIKKAEGLTKQLISLCANRVIERDKNVTVCIKDVIVDSGLVDAFFGYLYDCCHHYERQLLLVQCIIDFCNLHMLDEHLYNVSFCTFLQRLLFAISSSLNSRIRFSAVSRRHMLIPLLLTEITRTASEPIITCAECCMPMNVYKKKKISKFKVTTDNVLDNVTYNCSHLCLFSHHFNMQESTFKRAYACHSINTVVFYNDNKAIVDFLNIK